MSEAATHGLTSEAQELAAIVDLPRAPGKPLGYPKPPGSGRKAGQRNRRTLQAADAVGPLVPKAKRALRELLVSKDPATRLRAAGLIFAYVYGQPVTRREVTGAEGEPLASAVTVNNNSSLTINAAARAILGVLGAPLPALPAREDAAAEDDAA